VPDEGATSQRVNCHIVCVVTLDAGGQILGYRGGDTWALRTCMQRVCRFWAAWSIPLDTRPLSSYSQTVENSTAPTQTVLPNVAATPLWRKLVAIAAAGGLLVWVMSRINLGQFMGALSHIDHVSYLAFMFLFVIALLLADSLAIGFVYTRYICAVSYKEILVLRGASYLPSLINYHVGQAWLTWYVSRAYRARISRVTGATLLNYATIFGSLAILNAAAYPLTGGRIPWLGRTLVILGIGAAGYATVIVVRPRFLKRVPGIDVLFDAGLGGHILALLWRLPHVAVLFLGMWIPFRFFGVEIPMGDALAYVPILMLVGALPITPQGVGTRDAIALNLLAVYAPSSKLVDRITAATLCWAVAITLVYARRLFAKAGLERTAPRTTLR